MPRPTTCSKTVGQESKSQPQPSPSYRSDGTSDESPALYLTIAMEHVVISNFSTSSDPGGAPIDNISLDYVRVDHVHLCAAEPKHGRKWDIRRALLPDPWILAQIFGRSGRLGFIFPEASGALSRRHLSRGPPRVLGRPPRPFAGAPKTLGKTPKTLGGSRKLSAKRQTFRQFLRPFGDPSRPFAGFPEVSAVCRDLSAKRRDLEPLSRDLSAIPETFRQPAETSR